MAESSSSSPYKFIWKRIGSAPPAHPAIRCSTASAMCGPTRRRSAAMLWYTALPRFESGAAGDVLLGTFERLGKSHSRRA
ncbi:hypothetical protein NFJ02_11g04860 [Pycnococcus provasolii]